MSSKDISKSLKDGEFGDIVVDEIKQNLKDNRNLRDELAEQVQKAYNLKEEKQKGITHKAVAIFTNSIYYLLYIILVFVLLSVYQHLHIQESSLSKIIILIIMFIINLGFTYLIIGNVDGIQFSKFVLIIIPIIIFLNLLPQFSKDGFGFSKIPDRATHDPEVFTKLFFMRGDQSTAAQIESTIIVVQILVIGLIVANTTKDDNVITKLPKKTNISSDTFSSTTKTSKNPKIADHINDDYIL